MSEVQNVNVENVTRGTISVSGVAVLVPLDQLNEHPANPRTYFPAKRMEPLVESMRGTGFHRYQPMLACPRPEGGYWIGAGHRRKRAALLAGLTEAWVIVEPMTEEQLLDVLTFENCNREDPHPLDEAAGWKQWMKHTGKGVQEIAARVGQSAEYVYQRLKCTDAIREVQEAFLEERIKLAHCVQIARRPADEQPKALQFCLTPRHNGEFPSSHDLNEYFHQSAYVDLEDVCFDRNEAALVAGVPACSACPQLGTNIPGFIPTAGIASENCCTNRACHAGKISAHLRNVKEKLTANGTEIYELSDLTPTRKKGVLAGVDWEEAKRGDKDARPGLIVEGKRIGAVVLARPVAKPEPAPKPEPPKPPAPKPAPVPSTENAEAKRAEAEAEERERREREEQAAKAKRQAIDREMKVRAGILDAVLGKFGGALRPADVRDLLALHMEFDDSAEWLCERHKIALPPKPYSASAVNHLLLAALPKMKDAELSALVLEAIVAEECSEMRAEDDIETAARPDRLERVAKRWGVNPATIRREIEKAAKQAEGGTVREVVAKLPVMGDAPAKAKPAPAKTSKPAAKKAAPAKKASAAKKTPAKGGKK